MSRELEPSIVDYARFYGLIRDHLDLCPLQVFNASDGLQPQQLEDTPDLFQLHVENVKVPEERLAVDAGSASLLSSIAELQTIAPSRDNEYDGICTHRVSRMKHDLPLLLSDHELDLLRFARRIVPNLQNEFLPLEIIDEEADEGLTWPSKYYQLPELYDKKSKSEKLEIASDGLRFLQESWSYSLDGGEVTSFEIEDIPYKKVQTKDVASSSAIWTLIPSQKIVVEPLSPPLLPLSPIILPYVPSSETGHLDLLSDHTSPTRDEARQVERMLFDEDSITLVKKQADSSSQCSDPMHLESDSLEDVYSPLRGIKDLPSSPPPLRAPLQDRKVEVPLEPAEPEQPSPWKRKTVSFSEALPELIPGFPQPIPRPENTSSSDIDAYFAEAIAPIAIKAERAIEQEQLQEEDTMLRVKVPIMDFSVPVALWKISIGSVSSGDLLNKALTEMKALNFSKHAWPNSGKADRDLKWAPFPAALGKVETQEYIADDGSLEKYLAQPERVDVNTLTWKPEGLRILHELKDDDGEEIKEGTFPEEKDINSLLRKRKLALEADDVGSSPRARDVRLTNEMSSGNSLLTQTFFSRNALDSYLDVRKGVVTAPKSHHFPKHLVRESSENLKSERIPDKITQTSARTVLSLPAPNERPPKTPHPFVVSASFLSNRKLSRQIQRVFPSAEFIERDFNLYLDRAQRLPSKPTAAPTIASTIADEADMILSPSTGLIWTTLQKLKQRSLPGQEARSAIRERIIGARLRYELLIVLVSEDRGDMDNGDCEALCDFMAFCSASQDEVQVIYVDGGDDEVAKWIVAMMVKHTIPDLKLIQDETIWEVFLRRGGMNAFAAQAILRKLKAPNQDDSKRVADFGLTAFVKMSFQERVAKFETLLGGRRLLGRVSRVLDAPW